MRSFFVTSVSFVGKIRFLQSGSPAFGLGDLYIDMSVVGSGGAGAACSSGDDGFEFRC